MANLAEFYTEGSGDRYLNSGIHKVEVSKIRCFKYNSGSKGIEVECSNDGGKSSTSFSLAGKGPKRLASFAAACGLSQDDMKNYDLGNDKSHEILLTCKLQIEVGKDDSGYNEIKDWFSADADVHYTPPVESTQTPTQPASSDAIPF